MTYGIDKSAAKKLITALAQKGRAGVKGGRRYGELLSGSRARSLEAGADRARHAARYASFSPAANVRPQGRGQSLSQRAEAAFQKAMSLAKAEKRKSGIARALTALGVGGATTAGAYGSGSGDSETPMDMPAPVPAPVPSPVPSPDAAVETPPLSGIYDSAVSGMGRGLDWLKADKKRFLLPAAVIGASAITADSIRRSIAERRRRRRQDEEKMAMTKSAMLELSQALRSGDPELVKEAWAFLPFLGKGLLGLGKYLAGKKALVGASAKGMGWLGRALGWGGRGATRSGASLISRQVPAVLRGLGGQAAAGVGRAGTAAAGAARAGTAASGFWGKAKTPLMYGGLMGLSMSDPGSSKIKEQRMPLYDYYREIYRGGGVPDIGGYGRG